MRATTALLPLVLACTPARPPAAPSAAPAASAPPSRLAPLLASVDAARLRRDVDTLSAFGTRHTLSDGSHATRGIGAARRWILAEMQHAGEGTALRAELEVHTQSADGKRVPHDVELDDVVAVLPGAMPEAAARRYVVVGHYDSRTADVMDAAGDAPGANDDASGTAVVLELARVMARQRFDATLVFLATAGEEQGLYGAALHARAAKDAGLDVRAVLNDDIVGDPTDLAGAPHPGEIRVFSEGLPAAADGAAIAEIRKLAAESDSPSRELARFVADVAAEEHTAVQPHLVFRADRFLRGGDHLAFAALGVPAVRFTTPFEHYDRQHTPADVPAHVDASYLADVARLQAAVLARLANAPAPPEGARLVTAELANDTLVRWSACKEPDVAGYEVVWRDTTSPTWQRVADVGRALEARIPLSKDDRFFGVRAYDRDGNRSPVAFAKAAAQ